MHKNVEFIFPQTLSSIYGLPLHSAKLINRGVNITFKISADLGAFYLRLYRPRGRSREEIDGEIAALLAFRPADEVYVSKPQKLREGGYVFSCEYNDETRFACLFAGARGRLAESNAGDMRQFGSALAVLHRQMDAFAVPRRPFQPDEIIDETSQHLSSRGPQFRHFCRKIRHIGIAIDANLSGSSALRRGFCHGDAWRGNVHFSGPRTTFFDFDDCFDGPLVADLVPQIAWLWNATRSDFPALIRVLLDAYTSLSSLAETDFAAIPVLVQLHEICSIAFLAKYCSLDPVTWSQCLERSARTLEDWSPGGAANAHFAPLAGTARMARTRVA
jgi:Ser/Thr protein kinase RdoA (MazF antagonist)